MHSSDLTGGRLRSRRDCGIWPGVSADRLTIDDVAREAGVARVTVSRVLNGDAGVRDQTRARVREAIAKLGYSVNHQARALASGGARRIILFHAGNPDREPNSYYDSGLELGALRACSARGLDLASRTIDPDVPDLLDRFSAIVASERPSGVILPPPLCDNPDLIARIEEMSVPVAGISSSVAGRLPNVGIDDYAAGRAIARHLLDLGHRRIGFLSGPANHRSAATRLDGMKDELRADGLDLTWAGEGDFTFKAGIDNANQLITDGTSISALACANDDMAAGAMLTFHRAGYDLPADLSITGFDDTPVSQIVWPPLTTIRQPIQSYGELAVGMVTANGEQSAGTNLIPFELIVRESTATVA